MEITLGKTYYYNNRETVPIEKQGDTEFYKCVVNFSTKINFDGREFCTACMVGAGDGYYPSHSCEEYQDVIDLILSDLNDKDILFVPENMLHEKPFEFAKNEYLLKEIEKNKNRLENKKNELSRKIKNVDELQVQISSLCYITDQCQQEINRLEENISDLRQKELAIKESIENNKDAVIEGSKKTISIKRLLSLLATENRMIALENGGVDNWTWYDESIKDHDFEKEALEELLSM